MAAVTGNVGVQALAGAGSGVAAGLDRQGGLFVSELNARYSALSRNGNLFWANAIVTAPVIFSTAAGTGGPLLWNQPGSNVVVQPLYVGFGISVVSTVAATLGLTWNTGQNAAPTATTAIDSSGPLLVGGKASSITAFRVGTPSSAGAGLLALGDLDTGALTTSFGGFNWIDVGGIVTVAPGSWMSLATSATATTTVGNFSIIWAELPV